MNSLLNDASLPQEHPYLYGVVNVRFYWSSHKTSFVSLTYTRLIGLSFVELTTLFVKVVIVVAHRSVEAAQIHESSRMAGNINLLALRYLLFLVDRVDLNSVTVLNSTSFRFIGEWTISLQVAPVKGIALMTCLLPSLFSFAWGAYVKLYLPY